MGVPRSVWGVLEPKPSAEPVFVFTLRSFDHRVWWRVECVWREIARSVAVVEAKYIGADGREQDGASVAQALGIDARSLVSIERVGAAAAARQADLDPGGRHTVIVLPCQCQPGGSA